MSVDAPFLAYFRGDDGYALDRAAATVAQRLERDSGVRPERWRESGAATDASAIVERVATAPLFGGGTVAIVVDPAPLLRSKEAREALERAIRSVAPGNALVFIEQGDAGNRRAAALRNLEDAVKRAGGTAREYRAPRAGELAGWIAGRAKERNLDLSRDAAQALARRVGGFVQEGDVDRQRQGSLAVAELEKLALYRPGGQITADDVKALVSEVVPDSTWAFLDAIAERRVDDAGRLLDHLLESTPEPVILVQLHRRLRELTMAADMAASRATPAEMVKAIGGHPYRVQRIAEQARRWKPVELEVALDGVLELDAMVKGAPDSFRTNQQRRLAFVLWVRDLVHTGVEPGTRAR